MDDVTEEDGDLETSDAKDVACGGRGRASDTPIVVANGGRASDNVIVASGGRESDAVTGADGGRGRESDTASGGHE